MNEIKRGGRERESGIEFRTRGGKGESGGDEKIGKRRDEEDKRVGVLLGEGREESEGS